MVEGVEKVNEKTRIKLKIRIIGTSPIHKIAKITNLKFGENQ